MNPKHTAEIWQREMGFTHISYPRPIIATTRVTTCTVVWGYDPILRIGFLLHVDWPYMEDCLDKLFGQIVDCFQGVIFKFDVEIMNSMQKSQHRRVKYDLIKRWRKIKNTYPQINIKYIKNKSASVRWGKPTSFQLDTDTGRISEYSLKPIARKRENICRILTRWPVRTSYPIRYADIKYRNNIVYL